MNLSCAYAPTNHENARILTWNVSTKEVGTIWCPRARYEFDWNVFRHPELLPLYPREHAK
jgi:hypothetical protein